MTVVPLVENGEFETLYLKLLPVFTYEIGSNSKTTRIILSCSTSD